MAVCVLQFIILHLTVTGITVTDWTFLLKN